MAEKLRTWVAPVEPGHVDALRRLLIRVNADPAAHGLPFSRLPMLHFASLILFDEDPRQPLLVFESDIDQPRRRDKKTYEDELLSVARTGLDAVFGYCVGYPGADAPDAVIADYFERHKRKPQLYHIGHPNRSVVEIRGDHELRRAIARKLPELDGRPPLEIMHEIRNATGSPRSWWPFLVRPWNDGWSGPEGSEVDLGTIRWDSTGWPWGRLWRSLLLIVLAWIAGVSLVIVLSYWLGIPKGPTIIGEFVLAFFLVAMGSPNAPRLQRLGVAVVAAGLIAVPFAPKDQSLPRGLAWASTLFATFPLVLAVSFVRAWLGTRAFTAPVPPLSRTSADRTRTLLDADDRPAFDPHNHVAGVTIIRPGPLRWLRWACTWLVLRVLSLFYRTQFVKGTLVTIPTIHFAQWNLIDKDRLLFITNFDGAADLYLDDFFRSLALGVAFIWHETITFPATLDPKHLKGWVAGGRTLATVRYRATPYKGLTVSAINNNTEIRRDLLRRRVGPARARRWLCRFSGIPQEPNFFERFVDWCRALAGEWMRR